MPRIPEETIEQVRQSTDIVEIVSDYVSLTRRGKNYVGLCPFHDDRSPSLNVSQDKQIYKCFSCGAGGNVFTFLTELERISFVEAVRKLADRAGIALPEAREADRGRQEAFDALYAANELARKYFHHMLTADDCGAEAREYLRSRGVEDATITAFSLGYAPNRWDGFLQVAGRRGFSSQVLEHAGLAVPRQSGGGSYDRFRHRVIFPIQSSTGRTVAFGARALDPDEQAKYLNSPETPVYHKSNTLYGLWNARDAIRTAGAVLVVEGYMDLVSLVQRGIAHVVASSGTALTADHARLLRRYAERAVLVFDGDAAGTAASVRGIGSLFEGGLEVRVVSLPEGHDPDSLVRDQGPEAFLSQVEGARPVLDYLLSYLAVREDLSTADGKARATESLAEFIVRVRDGTRRAFLIREAAQKLGADESTLIGILRKLDRPRPSVRARSDAETGSAPPAFDPRPRAERELLLLMMSDDATADGLLAQVRPEDFSNSVYRRIAALIADQRGQSQTAAVAVLLDRCGDTDLAHILSALSMELGIVDPNQAEVPLRDYVHRFQLRKLNAEIETLEARIRAASESPDLRALLEKHRDLTARRKTLTDPQLPAGP